MGVHCTVCILYRTMMINQELGKEGVKKYKGKGGKLSRRVGTEGNIYYKKHVYELQGEEDSKD